MSVTQFPLQLEVNPSEDVSWEYVCVVYILELRVGADCGPSRKLYSVSVLLI